MCEIHNLADQILEKMIFLGLATLVIASFTPAFAVEVFLHSDLYLPEKQTIENPCQQVKF